MTGSRYSMDRVEWFYKERLVPLNAMLTFNCPPAGGPLVKLSRVIDAAKGGTLPLCFFLMLQYNNWSYSAYLIAALHGSYGMLWCLKGIICPDPHWDQYATLASCCIAGTVLLGYWSSAFIIITTNVRTSPPRMFVAILMYVFGVVAMIASDTQKYFVLQEKRRAGEKGFLINDGWFKTCRNTNYLGEMLLYASFCLLSQSIVPWCFTLSMWLLVFCSRFYEKEQSFARKKGGIEYIQSSSIILPMLLPPSLPLPSLFRVPDAQVLEASIPSSSDKEKARVLSPVEKAGGRRRK